MNILIREATEIDYPAINKMLLKLQNYHSKNVPTLYKKLDTFFTFDEYLKILEDRNVYFILATLDNEVIGLIWLSFNEKLSKYEYKENKFGLKEYILKQNTEEKELHKN